MIRDRASQRNQPAPSEEARASQYGPAVWQMTRDFLDAVLTGQPPLVTAENGVAVTTALEGIREGGIVMGDPKGKVYS